MKLEQEFFVGAHDVDYEKKVTNKAIRRFRDTFWLTKN